MKYIKIFNSYCSVGLVDLKSSFSELVPGQHLHPFQQTLFFYKLFVMTLRFGKFDVTLTDTFKD